MFTYGGHSTGVGITRDCEKYNLATINGWGVLQCTSGQVREGLAIDWTLKLFEREGYIFSEK